MLLTVILPLYHTIKMDNALQKLKCAVHFHFKNTHKLTKIFKIFIVSPSKVFFPQKNGNEVSVHILWKIHTSSNQPRNQRQHYAKLVCKITDTMLPMQLVHRKNMQPLEEVYGQGNKTVAVYCTDILEQKTGKDQRMYFLPKKSSS